MQHAIKTFFVALILCYAGIQTSYAKQNRQIIPLNHFSSLPNILQHQHLSAHVLFAFDLDNTLLKQIDYVGSPDWFAWQEQCFKKDLGCKCTKTWPQLLAFADWKLAQTPVALASPTIPSTLYQLAKQYPNAHWAFLTARCPQSEMITNSQLKKLNIVLPRKNLCPNNKKCRMLALGPHNSPTSMNQGIIYTCGANKAQVLSTMLHTQAWQPQTIVMADDLKSNLLVFPQQFKRKNIQLILLHARYVINAKPRLRQNKCA
jgi:hypothetical protein